MALFGFSKGGKDPAKTDELVLAYLEDALRVRSPFLLKDKQGETRATLHSVDEERGSFRLNPSAELSLANGGRLEFILLHEGLRLGGSATALDVRPGVLNLHLPRALELRERRRLPRARLNPKESASLSALQSLGEGVGLQGTLTNISEGGIRLRVNKAISIATEKPLMLGTKLITPGQAFEILKLGKVPRCPAVMECAGRAVYLSHDGDGIVMGFAFEHLQGALSSAIQSLVSSRAAPLPTELPTKARRKQEKQEEAATPAPKGLENGPSAARTSTQSAEGNWPERRSFPRVSTSGKPYGVRFRLLDVEIRSARLANLSASGCGLEVQMIDVRNLELGLLLQDLYLEHPGLPLVPLQAVVVRILGKVPGKTQGYALVGVEFTGLSAQIQDQITEHVAACIGGDEG